MGCQTFKKMSIDSDPLIQFYEKSGSSKSIIDKNIYL